ncbi:hypothetical protein JTB14_021187 [Gonioctena quinquepunctata]|nr:hypothetical protein JTB14_021187 [Gonioctena quinquepunctata]
MISVSADVGIFSVGMHYGWPSSSIPLLTNGNYKIQMTITEASWLTTILTLSEIFGTVVTAMAMKVIGRRTCILILSIPIFLSWLLIAIADSKIYLYFGRFIGGFVDGALFTVAPPYLSELADNELRGLFGTSIMVTFTFGIAAINIMVLFMSMVSIAYLTSALTVLMFISILFSPESPYYCILTNNYVEAEISIKKFKGKKDIQEDMDRIHGSILDNGSERGILKDLLFEKHYRKCLLISIGLLAIQHSSGFSAIQAYSETVLQESSNFFSPQVANSIYYLVAFIATMISPLVIERLGRKLLLLLSAGLTSLSLFAYGTYIYLKTTSDIDKSLDFIQMVLLLFFVISSIWDFKLFRLLLLVRFFHRI